MLQQISSSGHITAYLFTDAKVRVPQELGSGGCFGSAEKGGLPPGKKHDIVYL